MMKKNKVIWAAVCATALTLGGCGGGDGSASTSAGASTNNIDSTTQAPIPVKSAGSPFVGVWHSSAACSSGWVLVPAVDPGKGSFLIGDITFTETTMAREYSVFSDGACTQLVGTVTYNYDLTWSDSSLTGWSRVARVDARFNRYDLSNPSIELDPSAKEAPGHLTKSLFAYKRDQKNDWLYWADSESASDADGYPSALKSYPKEYRPHN
jgi:hypothetical protein